MSRTDWKSIKLQVLQKIDVLREYESWGFKPVGDRGENGWVNGKAIGRDDSNPSAGVYVAQGSNFGKYRDHGGEGESLGFFDAAVRFGKLKDYPEALKHYAEKVGVPLPQSEREPLTPLPKSLIHAAIFCRHNPGVKAESLERFGAILAEWNTARFRGPKQIVYALPIHDERGVCGHVLMPSGGGSLFVPQKNADPVERRKHTLKGSRVGWINEHAVKLLSLDPSPVEVVWKVEGVTDALALDGVIPAAVRDRHVVVTNANGATEFPNKTLRSLLRGKRVYVVHDADKAGEAGAEKWKTVLGKLGCKGGHVQLPYIVDEAHGKDLRDWLNEGNGYRELLDLADRCGAFPTDAVEEVDFSEVDSITINSRQLLDVTREALASLVKWNDPPTLFVREGKLIQCVESGDEMRLAFLDEREVRERLSRTARWIKSHASGEEDVFPPRDVCSNILASPSLPFPQIKGVAPAPMFDRKGGLHLDRGYCKETKFYNDFDSHIRDGGKPSQSEINDAKSLLLDELLVDFPFHDQSSRAGAIEFLLRPFARLLFEGPSPLTLIHAPTERTGKGLLLKAITIPFLGSSVRVSSFPLDDDEMRKRITSLLSTGRPIFALDNLPETKLIDSPSLAAMLTSDSWEDRILGQTKVVSMPATACWVATGNNPRLSSELCGRVVSVRLLSVLEDPSQREGFRHADLYSWAREHRWALVDSALTLIRAWVHAGRPKGKQILGGFEAWAATMGGILDVAGVEGLLGNRADFMSRTNEQIGSWTAFVLAWWKERASAVTGVAELVDIANSANVLTDVLGDGSPRSQASRLGRTMNRIVDRVFGSKMVVQCFNSHLKTKSYRLIDPSDASLYGVKDSSGSEDEFVMVG